MKQNPELIQKGGTTLYNTRTGQLVFVEKLALGDIQVKFETQPLASFNHVFNLEAFQAVAEENIAVYVREDKDAEGNEYMTYYLRPSA